MLNLLKLVWEGCVKTPAIPIIVALVLLVGVSFPILHTVEGWFGHETKQQTINRLEQNNAVLEDVSKGNQVAQEIAKADTEITNKVLDNNVEQKKTIDRKVDKIKQATQIAIEKIDASSVSEEDKVMAKSAERSISVWKTYCSFNENDDCAAIPKDDPAPTAALDTSLENDYAS